jgi:hypothetical protein
MRRIIYASTFILSALFFGCDKDGDGIRNNKDPIDNRTGAIDNPSALNRDNDTREMIPVPTPPPQNPTIVKIEPADKYKNLGPIEELFLKSAEADLADVKGALARGDDPGARCIRGKDYRDTLKAQTSPEAEAVMSELTKICDYEAPIKVMEREVSEAEKARSEQKNKPVAECMSIDFERAEKNLEESHPNDQKFKELEARWNTACEPT